MSMGFVLILALMSLSAPSTDAVSTKKGVCVGGRFFICGDLKPFTGISWWNDWTIVSKYRERIGCTTTPSQEFVQMVANWDWPGKNIADKIRDTSRYILGFNEPNHKEQSNMTPQEAADNWKKLEKQVPSHIKLVSPSAAPCGGGTQKCHNNTIEWFDEFFRLCENCRFDYLATHHYTCSPQKTINYLKKLYDRYKLPIWLTEFSCPRSYDVNEILAYMKGVLPHLEAADHVFRYSWYLTRTKDDRYVKPETSLLKPDSSELSVLGKYYNDYQP